MRLWSAEGPVDPRPGAGLVVEPRSRLAVRARPARARRAPRSPARWSATRGRVFSAVLRDRGRRRRPRAGVEWAVAVGAARDLAVSSPACRRARRGARVLVTNPGEEPTTVVRLRLSTGDGQFVPTGEDAVEVPAGTTVVRDLTEEAAGVAASRCEVAVRGRAGARRRAGGRPRSAASPSADLSYSAPGVPLAGPALRRRRRGDGRTARPSCCWPRPAQDARVVLTPVPLAGGAGRYPPRSRTVAVAGGAARAVPPGAGAGPRRAVRAARCRPADGSGPVHAALHLRRAAPDGPRTTTRVLQAALPPVPRPAVQGATPPWPARADRQTGRVDLVRVEVEQPGHLVDDDVVHQVGEVAAVDRAGLERPPVDDDPRGACAAAAGQQPAERHRRRPRVSSSTTSASYGSSAATGGTSSTANSTCSSWLPQRSSRCSTASRTSSSKRSLRVCDAGTRTSQRADPDAPAGRAGRAGPRPCRSRRRRTGDGLTRPG